MILLRLIRLRLLVLALRLLILALRLLVLALRLCVGCGGWCERQLPRRQGH